MLRYFNQNQGISCSSILLCLSRFFYSSLFSKNQTYWDRIHFQSIYLKCTVQCVLVYSWSCVTVTTINFRTFSSLQKVTPGTALAIQWLRLHASNAGDAGSIPGQGTTCRASRPQSISQYTLKKKVTLYTVSVLSQSLNPSSHWQPLIYCLSLWSCLFWTFHIYRIM